MVDFGGFAMRTRLGLSLLVLLSAAACQSPSGIGQRDGDAGEAASDIRLRRETELVEARVPRNATLETILRDQKLSADLSADVVTAVREVFNPRQIRANQPYQVIRTIDGMFRGARRPVRIRDESRPGRWRGQDPAVGAIWADGADPPSRGVPLMDDDAAPSIVASHHGKARLVGKDVRPRSSHPRRHDGAGQSTTGLPRHEPVIGEPDERSERGIRDGGRRRAHRAARDQPVATGCLTARSDDERRAVHVPAEIGAPRRSEAIVRPDRRKDADW